jgi:hypothetical protein
MQSETDRRGGSNSAGFCVDSHSQAWNEPILYHADDGQHIE